MKVHFRSASDQNVSDYTLRNDFQTLNNPGSGQPIDALKN